LVRTAPAPAAELSAHAALQRRASIPGIAPVLEDIDPNRTASGQVAVFAVASAGPTLESRVERGASPELVVGWCREAVRVLHSLALDGLELPDAAARRFNVDESGRLWLTDLWGMIDGGGAAVTSHVAHARTLCIRLLDALSVDITPAAVVAQINAATTARELLGALSLIAREP